MFNKTLKIMLKSKGKTVQWLASQMKVNYPHLCRKLKSGSFSYKDIEEIGDVLGVRFIILPVDKKTGTLFPISIQN